jgi:large subunit ribosomal protein L3
VDVKDNPVLQVKTMDKNGYVAVQLGQGTKKNATKPQKGHSKKGANLDYAPNFLREVRFTSDANIEELPKVGDTIPVATVLEAGDLVDVTGKSKGKGFAGVVKRHHFRGGPRTHGQSDRERAPGSIGQTTTPGRVYLGKRMAGKMGNETVTLKNLEIIDVTSDGVLIKGLVPGIVGTYLVIKKVGKKKNHVSLLKDEEVKKEEVLETVGDVKSEIVEEPKTEVKEESVKADTKEEAKPEVAKVEAKEEKTEK